MPYTIKTGVDLDALENNSQRKLARTSNGDLHCVYWNEDGSNIEQIYYAKSTDDGETWAETALTAESYDNSHPSIAVDSNDYLHVTWQGKYSGSTSYFQIRHREYTTSWQTIENLTSGNYHQKYPAVAVDSNDYLHIAFIGTHSGQASKYQLRYIKYTDSWQSVENLTDDSSDEYFYPGVAIDSNDYIHIAFNKFNWSTGNYEVHYIYYTSSWQLIEEVASNASYNRQEQSIAIDSNGNVHVAYKGSKGVNDHYIFYRKRTTSWETEYEVHNYTMDQWWPCVSVDANDYIDTLWCGDNLDNPVYKQMQHREYTSSWQTKEDLTDQQEAEILEDNSLWAYYPVINNARTNRPKTGFAYIYNRNGTLLFDSGGSLSWDDAITAKSITFNSFSFQDNDFRTEDIIYRNLPTKVINIEPKSRRDGFFLQNSYYSEKTITISGTVTRDTEAILRTSLNLMKEALHIDESNLDIDDGGTTMRYVATVASLEVPEKFYHITRVPYRITFRCQPFGKETSTTTDSKTITQASSSPYENAFNPTGSAPPLPKLRWACNGAPTAAITQIKFENTTTGESITVPSLVLDADGDYLEIDCDEMTVKRVYDAGAATEIDFTGVFTTFKATSNSYKVTLTGGGATWNLSQTIVYYPLYL